MSGFALGINFMLFSISKETSAWISIGLFVIGAAIIGEWAVRGSR